MRAAGPSGVAATPAMKIYMIFNQYQQKSAHYFYTIEKIPSGSKKTGLKSYGDVVQFVVQAI
jgi:hypothetical protein